MSKQQRVLLYMVGQDELVALEARLQGSDIEVMPIRSLDDATRGLELYPGALCLIEVRTSDTLGLAMIRQIHGAEPASSIVVLSSNQDLSCRISARNAGAEDYLATPIRNIDLEMRIARYRISESREPEKLAESSSAQMHSEEQIDEWRRAISQAQSEASRAHALAESKTREMVALQNRTNELQSQAHTLIEVAAARSAPGRGRRAPTVSNDERHADVDELTGLLGPGPLHDHLDREYARQRRYGNSVSLLLINVDHMTRYCKRHGRQAGDATLRLVADVLRSALRTPDIVAHMGSDSFAVLATDTNEREAMILGDRLRAALAEESSYASLPGATVSIGIAAAPHISITRASELLAAAERALRAAKASGRDCCRIPHPD